MSNEALDIQIGVSRETKDIRISTDRSGKTVSMSVDRGGTYYQPYEGPYEVTPAVYYQKRLGTKGKYLVDDVLVNSVPVTTISNQYGGKTITIGGN